MRARLWSAGAWLLVGLAWLLHDWAQRNAAGYPSRPDRADWWIRLNAEQVNR